MKRRIAAVLLAMALAAPGGLAIAQAVPAAAPADADVAALEALNARWLNAYISDDRAALDAILAEDFMVIRPNGTMGDRDSVINADRSALRAVRWENLQIRVQGDIAYVAARTIFTRAEPDGTERVVSNDYLDVYARRDGQWKAIAAYVVRRPIS
ncbi:nuclear transport factor 2 family protein [Brevundimonas sp. 2R-24]|uniref:Nuclear transport factor 2 family protein n=1 Tax=Peiella sedimenti TaxID=3061083 RepID=A0ABT8SLQ9_9CAUL|nr:nuclear transport factor 2 family protein [Caulobacteraceae bacterium XZ-24]